MTLNCYGVSIFSIQNGADSVGDMMSSRDVIPSRILYNLLWLLGAVDLIREKLVEYTRTVVSTADILARRRT